jgi:uncharacterized membrane protein YhhN
VIAAFVVVCLVAVIGLLVAERRESQTGKWATKPLASAAFIAIAVAGGALQHAYGVAIVAGLVLSMGGDVLLIPPGASNAFRFGAASFLLGHVAYCAAFLIRGAALSSTLMAAVLLAAVAVVVLRWLGPLVPEHMRRLVQAYVGVISVMLMLAIGTYTQAGDPRIVVGAVMFYLSDLSVARDRFVAESFSNRVWGLPLYFGGQVLLALSAGG